MAAGSRRAVAAAIAGNGIVALAKLVAFLLTGSAAMLSESLHSVADTMNQVLLMIGINRSTRRADPQFPFGYGAERAVWALMSAVGIFFLGCGVTLYHGVSALIHPHQLTDLWVAVAVLVISLLIEGYVLMVAVRAVYQAAGSQSFWRYLRHEADPTVVAVVLEDSVACLGVLIAMLGIALSHLTGTTAWDAIASILIGLLLGAIAICLIARSRRLLVGPAVPPEVHQQIRRIITSHRSVEKIINLRTRVLDTETYRVAADLEFDGEQLAEKLEAGLRQAYTEISSYEDFRAFATHYADDVVEALGDEIDAMEEEIRQQVPKARYLDIETE
jgi:zinc transporter 9